MLYQKIQILEIKLFMYIICLDLLCPFPKVRIYDESVEMVGEVDLNFDKEVLD